MSSAPGTSGSSDLDDEFLRVLDSQQREEEEDSEDQPSPSSSDERRETTIVQNLASAAATGTSTNDNATDPTDGVLDSSVHDIDQSRLAHQSNTNEDHANSDSRDGGIDASLMPLQQLSTPSHTSHTTTDEDTLSRALMNQVRAYNRLYQAHIQHQTSETETAGAERITEADDEDRSVHTQTADHDIQTSLRDLILESSEHKSDTNTIGTAHDSDSEVEVEGNRDRDRSVEIDQEILNAQEREYERLQQRRQQHEQEMESQANRQLAFERLFPMCNIEDEMGRRRRGRFVQNFHLATSTQTDVNTFRMVCASCSANLYTSPTAVLSFCPMCRNITTTIQEGKTPE